MAGSRLRVVLTTIGSMGDVHPYLAIARGLKARGHEAIVATCERYRPKVEGLGLGFRPLRPDATPLDDPATMRYFMDRRWGTIRCIREFALPALRDTYEDTVAASEGADLLVSQPLTYATRIVAERAGLPWISTIHTPLGLASAYDPPALPIIPELSTRLRPLGPSFWGPLRRMLTWTTNSWAGPIRRLRADAGLPPTGDNPLVDGHSPGLALALFSPLLSPKQPDWPPQFVHTGCPWFDGDTTESTLPGELARFLDDGPAPVVFTLGDSSGTVAGRFFERAVEAARRLDVRAVFAVGHRGASGTEHLPAGMMAAGYVPYSKLFPRAAAVVHAGGIGTSHLAMRAGRPMLVVPFAHDQPDNAARLARLGIARVVPARKFDARRAAAELGRLLGDPAYVRKAEEVGAIVGREDGAKAACDELEKFMGARHT